MHQPSRKLFSVLFSLLVVLILSCGLMPDIPKMLNLPPTPGGANVPTGSSPMSGDWTVNADFGYFAFTVAPDGSAVTTAVFKLSDWTCGGTTLTTELQELSTWPISDGQFSGYVNLNGSFHTMAIDGAYDKTRNTFKGSWQEDAHGSDCSGDWEAVARK